MLKKIRAMAAFFACSLLLSGCGSAKLPETIENTTVAVDSKGVVTSYLVDSFDKSYYSVNELATMAAEDVADYNAEHPLADGTSLKVEAVELLADGSKVMVQHVYNDGTVYEDYNGQELFFGTVSEALLAGYDLSALLTAVKDGAPLSQEELMKKPDKTHVLITDVKADIYCPYKVTHVGDGVVYREDGSVNTGEVDGVVVILMK